MTRGVKHHPDAILTCTTCDEILVPCQNWSPGNHKRRARICRRCNAASTAEWRKTRPDYNIEASRKYRAANPEAMAAYARRWRKAYPHKSAELSSRKRLAREMAKDATADLEKITEIYALRDRLSELTGVQYHVDHLVPITKGGRHHQENLVVMRWDINQSKSNKMIPWLVEFFKN